jgi:hypothetical protein
MRNYTEFFQDIKSSLHKNGFETEQYTAALYMTLLMIVKMMMIMFVMMMMMIMEVMLVLLLMVVIEVIPDHMIFYWSKIMRVGYGTATVAVVQKYNSWSECHFRPPKLNVTEIR